MRTFTHSSVTISQPIGKSLPLRSRLQIGSALVGAAVALTSPALAFAPDECGAVVNGEVTCMGPHASGAVYNNVGALTPLTINIAPGASMATMMNSDHAVFAITSDRDLSINQDGVVSTSGADASGIRVDAYGGAVSVANTGTLTTSGFNAYGVIATAGGGDRTITNSGHITTSGSNSSAVIATSQDGAVTVINAAGGTISTVGSNSLGIAATSVVGDVLIENHGSVATTGLASNAVSGVAYDGDLTLTSTGAVTTSGVNSVGVVLQNFGGDITAVIGSVSANGDNNLGISAANFSTGSVDLTTSGIISAMGVDGDGITAFSNGGSVKITNNADILAHSLGIASRAATRLDITNSGDIQTFSGNAYAIDGHSTAGPVTIVNAGRASTIGIFATGIKAANQTGAIVVDNQGLVSTSGFMATAVHAKTDSGAITLKNGAAGQVTTLDQHSAGLHAESLSGAITIDNDGAVSTSGFQGTGLDAKTVSGDITLTNAATGNITTAGGSAVGIRAESQTGAISITNQGIISATGGNAYGISAETADAGGDISLISHGAVSTTGDFATAIRLQALQSDIRAEVSSVSTTGSDSDAVNLWTLTGDVTLDASGTLATSGADSDAILASTQSGTVQVNSAAAITTTGDSSSGISAQASSGTVSVVSTGAITTTGNDSYGVAAQSENDVTISAAAVTTGGSGAALHAHSLSGIAKIVANGLITTTGDYGDGVHAIGNSGSVDILTLAAISTSGENGNGVRAGSDSADIAITTAEAVTTTGDFANAILAESDSGKITILAKAPVSTSGENADAIDASSAGDISVTTATVTTSGYSSDAINVNGDGDLVTIIAQGLISTSGDYSEGIDARNDTGDLNVTVGSVTTTGADSSGLDLYADGIARVVSTGAITTEGSEAHGVDVNGGGGIFIDVNSVSTLGQDSDGVLASSNSNTATIKVNSVSATGYGSRGVNVSSEVGDMFVTAGAVSAHDQAIRASSGEGDITVSTTGRITSTNAEAILATSQDGDVALNIGAASVLTSGVRSINPASVAPKSMRGVSTIYAEGETVLINNAGTINRGEESTIAAQGEVTLNNSGLITGNVEFGAGDDVVNNTGRFVLSGFSDFGGGSDRFVNTGLVTMQGHATLARLERFVNAGTINLADGRVGDVLTISGDYVGMDGRLVLDMDAGATGGPAYDQLVVGGSATGTTTITLNYKTAAQLKPGAVLKLVDAAGGSAAGAFTMADETTNIGFARYGVRHDVAADDFFIAVTEGDAVFRTLKLNEGAQTLWRQSADAWSAHTAALRDPSQAASDRRVWGQVYGAADKRDETLIRAGNGVDQTVDLSYTQDHVGGQMGVDLGVIGATGVTYGLTGGYVDSTLEFKDKADSADYKGLNLGAYAGVQRGRYFVNALAKYDLIDIQARSTTAGYDEDLDGRGYGLQVETGARFNGKIETQAFFFEPVVSLAYSRTDLDALASQGAVIDFEALDGLRAKAGARLGGAGSVAQGQIGYYLGAHLVQELAGEDGVRFTSGAADSAFANTAVDAYGQYQLGVTFTSKTGLTGFIEAKADAGEDYRNYTGRIGVRVSF